MKHLFASIFCLALIFNVGVAQILSPNDVLIDEYVMDFMQYAYHATPALGAGTNYYLRVTGTYGISESRVWADGAYDYDSGPPPYAYRAWLWNGSTTQRPSPDVYEPTHVYYFPFVSDGTTEEFLWEEYNPNNYGDNAGSLTIQVWRSVPPCPPTALPFVDNFDSPTLDSCWFWIREDSSHWSLTERPGWMRLAMQPGDYHCGGGKNFLVRNGPLGNYRIETHLQIPALFEGQGAGLLLTRSDCEYVILWRQVNSIGQQIVLQGGHDCCANASTNVVNPLSLQDIWLRLDVQDSSFEGFWSADGNSWTSLGVHSESWLANDDVRVGILAEDVYSHGAANADFDNVSISRIPTMVCGDASGVWDLAHSPYYVNCDVTVPVGQTLTIQPGVQVLFTGHYKFYVLGNLQAIGTEQDSIVFTRAFPTEESRGWGVRIENSNVICNFDYCSFSYGKTGPTSDSEAHGGAVLVLQSAGANFNHCAFRDNYAFETGGAICVTGWPRTDFVTIHDCLFERNEAAAVGGWAGGGAIGLGVASYALVNRCVFNTNHSGGSGGAIDAYAGPASVINSSFYGNTCGVSGSVLRVFYDAHDISLVNSIAWANGASVFDGSVNVTYSDIQGGYPGAGNINADPLFTDAANGDFHLTYPSPCIDTGDPASPLDPDGSRTDMGAFPYSGPKLRVIFPNGGENWTLFNTDTIRWSGTGFAGGVMIELNRDYPNGPWEVLVESTDNDGGEPVALNEPISSHCRVRVSAVEDVFTDVSDGDFSLVPSQGYLALVRSSVPGTAILAWNAGTLECPQTATEVFRFKNFGSAAITVFRADNVSNPAFSRITDCALSYSLAAGEMSACGVTLSFAPEDNGSFVDTLRVHTNASNGVYGYVNIPLSGSQISTPATPQVVIATQGPDAHLWWPPITQSTGGCPVTITRYLVFFAENSNGPFWFHGATADTAYIHAFAVQYAAAMFYRVYAVSAPGNVVDGIPQGMREEEVWEALRSTP